MKINNTPLYTTFLFILFLSSFSKISEDYNKTGTNLETNSIPVDGYAIKNFEYKFYGNSDNYVYKEQRIRCLTEEDDDHSKPDIIYNHKNNVNLYGVIESDINKDRFRAAFLDTSTNVEFYTIEPDTHYVLNNFKMTEKLTFKINRDEMLPNKEDSSVFRYTLDYPLFGEPSIIVRRSYIKIEFEVTSISKECDNYKRKEGFHLTGHICDPIKGCGNN